MASHSHASSVGFENELGAGWRAGLSYADPNLEAFHLNDIVRRADHTDLGDVDGFLRFYRPTSVSSLFPAGETIIRPNRGKDFQSRSFFAELKRGLHNLNIEIHQFVHFYKEFFNSGPNDLEHLRHNMLIAKEDTSAILLFVYNNVDSVTVETTMRNTIVALCGGADNMKINGRCVVCVWAHASKLIEWESLQKLADKEAECEELKRMLKEAKKKNKRDEHDEEGGGKHKRARLN